MRDFQVGERVRLTDTSAGLGTVVGYTEETIGQNCDRFLIVRRDDSDSTGEPIHQARFETAT